LTIQTKPNKILSLNVNLTAEKLLIL
jgi:hypothetical protein